MVSAEALELGRVVAPAMDLRNDVVDVGGTTTTGTSVLDPRPLTRRLTEQMARPALLPARAVSALRRPGDPQAAGAEMHRSPTLVLGVTWLRAVVCVHHLAIVLDHDSGQVRRSRFTRMGDPGMIDTPIAPGTDLAVAGRPSVDQGRSR